MYIHIYSQHDLYGLLEIIVYIYKHTYTYIQTLRERARERETCTARTLNALDHFTHIEHQLQAKS